MLSESSLLQFYLLLARTLLALSLIRPIRQLTPFSARLGISLALAIAVFPTTLTEQLTLTIVLGELLLVVLRFAPLAIALESFAIAGRVIDLARGAQFAEQVQPQSGARESLFEQLAVHGSLVFLFASCGSTFFSLLVEPLASSRISAARALETVEFFGQALARGLCLAAPVLCISLLIDLAAAFGSRVLGRVNLLFEVLPAKLALGVLFVAWRALSAASAELGFWELLNSGS